MAPPTPRTWTQAPLIASTWNRSPGLNPRIVQTGCPILKISGKLLSWAVNGEVAAAEYPSSNPTPRTSTLVMSFSLSGRLIWPLAKPIVICAAREGSRLKGHMANHGTSPITPAPGGLCKSRGPLLGGGSICRTLGLHDSLRQSDASRNRVAAERRVIKAAAIPCGVKEPLRERVRFQLLRFLAILRITDTPNVVGQVRSSLSPRPPVIALAVPSFAFRNTSANSSKRCVATSRVPRASLAIRRVRRHCCLECVGSAAEPTVELHGP